MAVPTEALKWRQARQWLINSEVIPPAHRVTKPDVDLVDFARSLRDGVFLCSLVNKLKPNCVEDWSPKPLTQHLYLRNISSFLQACHRHFHIQEKDLFMDSDLYDMDNFQKVMQLLSKLSYTPEALNKGWIPFPCKEHNNEPDEENLYESLSNNERLYTTVRELYSTNPDEPEDYLDSYGHESIYDTLCSYQRADADEKKAHILEEFFATEKSFVRVLELICKTFYQTLKDLVSPEDCRLLFDSAQLLYPVHRNLLDDLARAMDQNHDLGCFDVTQYFLSHHRGLLHYGQYAVRLPSAVEKAKMLQSHGKTARALQLCQQSSGQRFPLSDLLHVPIQRVLKYPLLMKDLLKCTKKQALPNQSEVNSLEQVIGQLEDLAKYINSTKGDAEHMKQIEEVEQTFSDPPTTPLLQCSHYWLDGELKVKTGDGVSRKMWVFLFDKAMLMCCKAHGGLYAPKEMYQVAQLSVEPMPPQAVPKSTFGFRLIVAGNSDITCYTKTEMIKYQWIDAINGAREAIAPRDGNKGNHSFELTTFDEACLCDVCNKLLYGCYFQGYYCQVCKRSAHKNCLKDVRSCTTMQPPAALPLKGLMQFPWFVGKMNRIDAEQCLHRMKDGVFLIRESAARRGEYAIALRWYGMPKHIKICKHPETRKFYVADVCDFHSVWELVEYYQLNSLGTSFPRIDTTLKYPFKEVYQCPRGWEQWAEAKFSFVPKHPDEMRLEKHDHVLIIQKETNKPGWWYGSCNGRSGLFPFNYVRELP